jgi:hypothetical protein
MTAGNGVPTVGEGGGGGLGVVEEGALIHPMSVAYDAALKRGGIDVSFESHNGCHCWPDFRAELRSAIAWGPFEPVVEHPQNWVNDTVATHGQLWDIAYRFASHPNAVVRFTRTGSQLQISAAGTSVTLTTNRGCVLQVSTPAVLQIPSRSCIAPRRRHRRHRRH